MKTKILLLFLLSLICWSPAHAFFEKDIKILTMQNGLADNTVFCIHKGADGFMWFGTNTGLSRYDGKTFKNYGTETRNLKIRTIHESSSYLLWLVTDDGITCFDRKTEQFIPVHFPDESGGVQDVLIQNDSLIWGITDKELSLFCVKQEVNPSNNLLGTNLYLQKTYTFNVDKNSRLAAFCHSPDGKIYISTNQGEIITFDLVTCRTSSITRWAHDTCLIHHILYHKGCIWISTLKDGLIQYNPASGSFQHYTYTPDNLQNSLSHTDVYQLVPINDHCYLAATWNGYTLLLRDKDNPSHFTTEIYNDTPSMIQRNIETRMICAYYDPEGMLWIGTEGGGILFSDLRLQFYEQYHQNIHNEVCGMAVDKKGAIWLATYHKGIMKSQTPFEGHARVSFQVIPTTAGNTILCIAPDEEGNLWFGNDSSLLACYQADTETISFYPLPSNKQMNEKIGIRSLYIDKTYVWLGTEDGLLSFDRKTKQFVLHPLGDIFIRAITCASDSSLWLGTTTGVKKYHIPSHTLAGSFEKRADLPVSDVRSLLNSSEGNLYVGYADGLGLLDTQKDSLVNFYTTQDGLCSNFIGCMIEDSQGHLWLGSNSGISRYSKRQRIFYNYYISGNNRSALLCDGYLFWGNNKNITYFNPESIKNNPTINDHVVFTQLEVDNKPVEIKKKINGQLILSQAISYMQKITLTNENNSFSLIYSNLSYSNDLQKYSYRLTPYQSQWNISEEGEKVSYANLPAGEYTFEVRSIFPDGSNGKATTLDVTILPHWSELLWVRAGAVCFVLLVIFFIIKRMMKEQARLVQEKELKHALSIARLEQEKERQINKERSNFFTNVSHELRTPLTLILSPLQELLHRKEISSSTQNKLQLVYNNASFLSGLVDQLLYIQKIEAGMIQLHLSEVEIVSLVKAIMTPFRPMAESKEIEFILDSGIYRLPLYIDISKIESALRNLLSNALKYTPEGGSITVKITEEEKDGMNYCVIAVEDTGVGIPEHLQEKVFDSFITGEYEPSYSTKVGIGLRIVKNTMDLHHGMVSLDSAPGKGSRFTLYIPEGKEHFKADEYLPGREYAVKTQPVPHLASEAVTEQTGARLNKTILIIEDNGDVRAYIKSLFCRNYRILEAENGETGVRMATDELPDLIISDVMMPVKDGFTCCKEIRQQLQTAYIPIIILTAKAEDMDVLQGIALGIDDYIMKPFNPEVLKAKADNLIRIRTELKHIYTKTLMLKQQEEETEENEDSLFMQRVINLVESNLTNPDFSVTMLAERLNLSQPTLYRRIKSQTNLSILEFVRSIRMSKAVSLIMQKKYSVIEVAERVGYNDITTFRKHFTNQFGVPPSKYNL